MAMDMQEKVESFELEVGDLLVDSMLGTFGVLMEMKEDHHIAGASGYYHKSRFWRVYWVSNHNSFFAYNGPSFIEEYGLKMSIVIGVYDHYPSCVLHKQEKI